MRTRVSVVASIAGAAALLLGGCGQSYTFSNRSDTPVVVAVSLFDPSGRPEQVSGSVVEPDQAADITVNHDGRAIASIWKGRAQQGAPAARLRLDGQGRAFEIRNAGSSISVQPEDRR